MSESVCPFVYAGRRAIDASLALLGSWFELSTSRDAMLARLNEDAMAFNGHLPVWSKRGLVSMMPIDGVPHDYEPIWHRRRIVGYRLKPPSSCIQGTI